MDAEWDPYRGKGDVHICVRPEPLPAFIGGNDEWWKMMLDTALLVGYWTRVERLYRVHVGNDGACTEERHPFWDTMLRTLAEATAPVTFMCTKFTNDMSLRRAAWIVHCWNTHVCQEWKLDLLIQPPYRIMVLEREPGDLRHQIIVHTEEPGSLEAVLERIPHVDFFFSGYDDPIVPVEGGPEAVELALRRLYDPSLGVPMEELVYNVHGEHPAPRAPR